MLNIFGNVTSNETISWQPEPTTRGTFSVLSICLITISLCVWTAIHLNVPEHEKGVKQVLKKAKWMLVGLVAPELILSIAWCQYIQARAMVKLMSRSVEQNRAQSRTHQVRHDLETGVIPVKPGQRGSVNEMLSSEPDNQAAIGDLQVRQRFPQFRLSTLTD